VRASGARRVGALGLGEVLLERAADQLVASVTDQPDHLFVHVGDGEVGIDRDQRVDRRLDQPAVVDLRFAELLFEPPLLGNVARDREDSLDVALHVLEHRRVERNQEFPADDASGAAVHSW